MRGTGDFGVKMNQMPKYVVASTRDKLDWPGSRVIKGDVADEVRKLKQQPGKDLLLSGSAMLFNSMLKENLVDLYRLMVHPAALGQGQPLVTAAARRRPDLTTAKRF